MSDVFNVVVADFILVFLFGGNDIWCCELLSVIPSSGGAASLFVQQLKLSQRFWNEHFLEFDEFGVSRIDSAKYGIWVDVFLLLSGHLFQ